MKGRAKYAYICGAIDLLAIRTHQITSLNEDPKNRLSSFQEFLTSVSRGIALFSSFVYADPRA
eukprot:c32916_g1_i1 orf=69-257(-)